MYYLTGSQQFHLMKNVSESLAGRIGILQLLGLSLRETGGDSFSLPFVPTAEYLTRRNRDKDQKEIDLLIMENGTLYPLEIKKTATPRTEDVAAFKVLSAVKGVNIETGGLICMDNSLGILEKNRYSIPVTFI